MQIANSVIGTTVHRGYLIVRSPFDCRFRVCKGAAYIASYTSLRAAKAGIDELVDLPE